MAKSRNSIATLTKTLERTASIVYLVGSDRCLQYANPACAAWLGLESPVLNSPPFNGAPCIYSSEEFSDLVSQKLAGLCPPPELFELLPPSDTESAGGFLPCCISSNNSSTLISIRWRTAIASRIYSSPINSSNSDFSVLVIGAESDLATPPAKPTENLTPPELHAALAQLRQLSHATHRETSLIGTSALAHRLRRQANLAAHSAADLLIIGPAGSGKKHLARTIHHLQPGNSKSDLVPVQCALADPLLIEAIFNERLTTYKREKKIATWPATTNPPPIASASVLLQDADCLSPTAQIELLRFLQSPELPLRVFATAETSLLKLAEQDQYLPELAYFLSTMAIELLPLSERVEDIPLLAQAMLERENRNRNTQLGGFDKGAIQLLMEFQWPDNLKQLNQTVQEAATHCESRLITPHDLPKKFHDSLSAQRIGKPAETNIDLDVYLQTIERELLQRALTQAKGNKTKAAKLLGLNRAKFLRRLQFFQLDADTTTDFEEPDFIEPSDFEEIE